MSQPPLIIGARYTPEQIFSMAQRGARAGVEALHHGAKCSPHTARAFLAVAIVKEILKHANAEKTKNFLGAVGDVVDATKEDKDNVQLTERVMNALNKATMALGESS